MREKTFFKIYAGILTVAGLLLGVGGGIYAAIRFQITNDLIAHIFMLIGSIALFILTTAYGKKYRKIINSIK